jgi:SAM-dependent methyltransferase
MQPEDGAQFGGADEAAIREQLLDLLWGFIRTQALAAVAALGIADLVSEEPTDVEELARRAGAHAPSLYRLLRALSMYGVFAEAGPRCFVRTPLSDGLRTDAPQSARWSAILAGSDYYQGWSEALHSFRTGKPGFDRAFGLPYFDYLQQNAEASAVFNRAMGAGTQGRLVALVAYDWSSVRHVVDLGGGNGTALAAVLAANPQLTGSIFELEAALPAARTVMDRHGVASRCNFVAGNFLVDDLPPADAYLLSQILHDWDDRQAATILRNCKRSLQPDGRLLILDSVLAAGPTPDPRKLFDLHMLVLLGGKERTETEWTDLLSSEGFSLHEISAAGPSDLLEARPS